MRHNLQGMGQIPLTVPPQPAVQPATQFYEEPGDLVLDKVLTANQEALRQAVQVDEDSDFLLLALVGNSTSTYNIVLYQANNRAVNSAYAKNTNYVGSANFPVPLLKELYYPAGASIRVDVKDTSGAGNTIQLIFKGIRRYRLAA